MATLRPDFGAVNHEPKTPPPRSRLERQTSIIWNDAEPTASIETYSPKAQRHLRKLGYEAAQPQGPYFVPKNQFTIRRPGAKKVISKEHLEALGLKGRVSKSSDALLGRTAVLVIAETPGQGGGRPYTGVVQVLPKGSSLTAEEDEDEDDDEEYDVEDEEEYEDDDEDEDDEEWEDEDDDE